jgi:hypothetical protein
MTVGMSGFCFNITGAILGRFENVEAGGLDFSDSKSPPCHLTHFNFIATHLLPCSQIDAPIQKFTGNHDEGGAPGAGDYLTVTLHAFTHYVAVFPGGIFYFVICKVQ